VLWWSHLGGRLLPPVGAEPADVEEHLLAEGSSVGVFLKLIVVADDDATGDGAESVGGEAVLFKRDYRGIGVVGSVPARGARVVVLRFVAAHALNGAQDGGDAMNKAVALVQAREDVAGEALLPVRHAKPGVLEAEHELLKVVRKTAENEPFGHTDCCFGILA